MEPMMIEFETADVDVVIGAEQHRTAVGMN